MDFDVIGLLASVLGVGTGAVAAGFAGVIFRQPRKLGPGIEETQDPEEDSRLQEARAALKRQEFGARWNGRATGSLTFGQYIIGGVLASSFMQETLTSEIVGALGVLVLISSLVHRHYRPDLIARGARQRAFQLRKLVRATEDGLFAIKSGRQDAASLYKIRMMVSKGLAEIEESEIADVEIDTSEQAPA